MSNPVKLPFTGARLRAPSTRSFDELTDALFDAVGCEPIPLEQLVRAHPDWDSFERALDERIGPSGFTLFTVWDHGGWIGKAGIHRRALRVVIGNPLIAITMLRHDVTAGLFAPVELFLTDEPGGGSALTYVQPSSLMVVEPNPPLLEAALALDNKLAELAGLVTG